MELREAVKWYEDKQEGLGLRFYERVDAVVGRVSRGELPGLGLITPKRPQIRKARVPTFPYWVYFEFTAMDCVILAVAHKARRPGYWIQRSASDPE